MTREFESKMHEAAANDDWDTAISYAKKIPKNWAPWDSLAASYTIPPSHFEKFINAVPQSEKPNVLFEVSSNLHPDLTHEQLDLLGSLDDSGYVQEAIAKHPNWEPHKNQKTKNEMAASSFWQSYERKVDPHHFAAVKSMYSGKPETIKSHRSEEEAYSHGEHYVGHDGTFVANATSKMPLGNYRLHDEVIPHLKTYAEKVQKAIENDPHIPKKIIKGVPHIQVWRGVGGEYAKKLKNAASTGKQKLNIQTAPFSSWTTNKEIARNFAANRHEIGREGQSSHTAILSAWIPISSVLHSGYHHVHTGQRHAHPMEEEIVVGHPTGRMVMNTKDIEFGRVGKNGEHIPEPIKTVKKPKPTKLAASESHDLDLFKFDFGFFSKAPLKKLGGLGSAAAAAAISIGSIFAAPKVDEKQHKPLATASQKSSYDRIKERHLKAIEMQESNGGKNMLHKQMPEDHPIHGGERAYGRYGLMPNTVRFVVKYNPDLKQKYGHYMKLEGDRFHNFMHKHPELEQKVASRLYDMYANRFGQNLHAIYHAWFHGPAKTERDIKNGINIENHPLVRKVVAFHEKFKQSQ
jgi:hypothetical protein